MQGSDIFHLYETAAPVITPRDHYPIWIESVWRDEDGTIYAWYHHEPGGVCPGNGLTAPKIGALLSGDGGLTFQDLGIVLETGDPLNCNAKNGFFAGGHGDFSVIPDQDHQYFYFLFGNYSGPKEHQGVAIARMAFGDRANPVGLVYKYHDGAWTEPGIGGLVTPIFPPTASWEGSNPDAMWGPSIHWNSYLNQYVVVMNHTCCKTGWAQEGIYVSINPDLSDPENWSRPVKILDASRIGFSPGFYPQFVGVASDGTDTLAGKTARLFVKGVSKWEVEFLTVDEPGGQPAPSDPDPGPGSSQQSAPLRPAVIPLRPHDR